jgi:hypothetical protein
MLHNRTQTGEGQLDSLLKGGIDGFARMVAVLTSLWYSLSMNVSTPTEQVRAWLEHLPSEKKLTVEALRRLIGSVAPEAHEIISHDAFRIWSHRFRL